MSTEKFPRSDDPVFEALLDDFISFHGVDTEEMRRLFSEDEAASIVGGHFNFDCGWDELKDLIFTLSIRCKAKAATARADGRREGLEKTHAHLVGAIAAEEFLRDVARRARDNEDALIHGYAADALRQSATAIRAMMEKE